MSILPKEIYRFSAIPIKILMTFFTELEKTILKCIWNHKKTKKQKTQNSQSLLEQKEQQEALHCLTSKYYKAIVIKIA
jgi:hypothetical protein